MRLGPNLNGDVVAGLATLDRRIEDHVLLGDEVAHLHEWACHSETRLPHVRAGRLAFDLRAIFCDQCVVALSRGRPASSRHTGVNRITYTKT